MRFIRSLFARPQARPRPERVTVMVVGMHRSGTSFLTGSLQQAGLELGSISAWNPHNLKGNRENLDIVAFSDEVLERRGCAWDKPPSGAIEWAEEERAQARELIAGYADIPRWGFKDPRSLLLVEGWQELLPELQFVGIFRHPTAVAQSLAARGGMSEEQAFALWLAYNQRLLKLYRKSPFPLLCFDESEVQLHRKLGVILDELGLDQLGDERFFSAELKHHRHERKRIPMELERLYRELRRCAR